MSCRISGAFLHASWNTHVVLDVSARTITAQHRKLISLVNGKYFSLLTPVLAFHLVRKLNLRSSSVLSSLTLNRNERHTLNPQTSLKPQHPRMNLLSCGAVNCAVVFFFSPPPCELEGVVPVINKHKKLSDLSSYFFMFYFLHWDL